MPRSPLALAALATAAVPGLDVVATQSPQYTTADFAVAGLLDSGGRRWVVRCPLHPAAGASLEGEVALLERLAPLTEAGALPFDVPRPEGFAPLTEGGRAMVYRQLPGRRLDLEHLGAGPGLAADLGRALAAIHELPTALVADAGLPVYDAEAYRLRRLAEVDEAARTGHVPPALLQRWERALEDVALWRFRATPVHGDLTEEHVLVAGGELAAVLSWSEAHVGDPAEDLAWILATAPAECLDTVEEAYALARAEHADSHLMDRALLVSELALARWLLHGVRSGEEAVVRDAVAMLATLARQTADEPPIGFREPVVVDGREASWSDADDDAEGYAGVEDGLAEASAAPPPVPDAGLPEAGAVPEQSASDQDAPRPADRGDAGPADAAGTPEATPGTDGTGEPGTAAPADAGAPSGTRPADAGRTLPRGADDDADRTEEFTAIEDTGDRP
ncbi:phosphotransferase [Georgenia faecalis]|uniref:phosphotransferase n=1 Tax=Georgenia faecalis TaxID=2483799 RepID=UPI000FDB19DC